MPSKKYTTITLQPKKRRWEFKMTITIYYGVNTTYSHAGMRADPPQEIIMNIGRKLFKERVPRDLKGTSDEVNYHKCPAVVEELKNIYGIKSYYDYKLNFEPPHYNVIDPGVSSSDWDPDFFKKHINIRSLNGNFFSFAQDWAFFTEEPSLEVTILPAFLEDNSVANNTIMIPGTVDVGKYFRGLDYAFHVKEHAIGKDIQWSRKDIFCYFRFNTNEQLKFKRFYWTVELEELNFTMMQSKHNKYDEPHSMTREYYYNLFDKFNMKEKMLKIIKENLCKDEDSKGNVI